MRSERDKVLTQGGISRLYKDALASVLDNYSSMQIVRIIKDAYLLEGGVVREEVDIVFQYKGKNRLRSFFWYIPRITAETRVEGLRIPLGVKARGYTITQQEKLSVIDVGLDEVTNGTMVHLKFDYYIMGASSQKGGFLHNELYYPMAFIAAETVQSLDIRIHLPKAGAPIYDTNLPDFHRVVDKDEQVLLSSRDGIVGDFSGYVTLKYRTAYYKPFWTAMIGILFAGALRGVQAASIWIGDSWYLATPILTSLALFTLYSKVKD